MISSTLHLLIHWSPPVLHPIGPLRDLAGTARSPFRGERIRWAGSMRVHAYRTVLTSARIIWFARYQSENIVVIIYIDIWCKIALFCRLSERIPPNLDACMHIRHIIETNIFSCNIYYVANCMEPRRISDSCCRFRRNSTSNVGGAVKACRPDGAFRPPFNFRRRVSLGPWQRKPP